MHIANNTTKLFIHYVNCDVAVGTHSLPKMVAKRCSFFSCFLFLSLLHCRCFLAVHAHIFSRSYNNFTHVWRNAVTTILGTKFINNNFFFSLSSEYLFFLPLFCSLFSLRFVRLRFCFCVMLSMAATSDDSTMVWRSECDKIVCYLDENKKTFLFFYKYLFGIIDEREK